MGEHIIYDSVKKDSDIRFEDEGTNLDMELDGNILVIADLGLWNGRRRGYKILGTNLRDILFAAQGDCYRVYFDSTDGEVKADDVHHDGTNHYLFREIRRGVHDHAVLTGGICGGTYAQRDIDRYTKSLGKRVRRIYGWRKDRVKRGRAA